MGKGKFTSTTPEMGNRIKDNASGDFKDVFFYLGLSDKSFHLDGEKISKDPQRRCVSVESDIIRSEL